MSNKTLINGEAYSWSQIALSIGENEIYGISKISYSDNVEMQNNYGRGNFPVSRGYGKYAAEASITLSKAEVVALIRTIPTKRLQDVKEFDIPVAYMPEDGEIVTDKIMFCRFLNNGVDVSRGDMEMEVELNLIVGKIEYDV